MRIVGHGVDVQELKWVERLLANPEKDWLDAVFTELEQASADSPPNAVQYYAGRYAAKEAVAKALGTGFSGDIAWLDIEIRRAPTGAPEVHLTDAAAEVAGARGITAWFLSLSHSGEYALASVIAVTEP
jgi:holo-[acyl-carrier protein] synthase